MVFSNSTLYAQGGRTAYRISGTVVDSTTMKPLDNVLVSVVELNIWSYTDLDGRFSLRNIPEGTFSINFYCLGYKEVLVKRAIRANLENWTQALHPFSLSLKEVTVTAREMKMGSASVIENTAIEHLQPKSLTDVFQLLPGQITENPSLKDPGQIKIREISSNSNSALGALIIVDGAPISNDANMQTFQTSQSGNSSSAESTAGRGVDLRAIPADNLESVEVIRGIPSSEYGNITSGVVLVKTRVGEQPWTAKAKIDPNTKMGSLYKGLRLSPTAGILNLGVDYTQAYDDLRKKMNGYKRFTGSLAYTNTFLKSTNPLDLNVKFSYFSTIDEDKSDPQLKQDEVIRSSDKGIRWGIDGKWMLRKPWITSLEYSLSGDQAVSKGYVKQLLVLSTGAVPYPTSYEDGIFEEQYLPGVFYTEYENEGKPYNIYFKLKGNWNKQFGRTTNALKAGIDISVSGNEGKGLTYDLSAPPMRTIESSTRPRAYKDIPSLRNYAFYIEDKLIQPIGTMELTTQFGLRFVHVQPGDYFAVEPRLNASLEILNQQNNSLFDALSLTFGFGLSSKMPTLSYSVPDKAYFDDVSLNYLDGDHSLAVITTKVLETTNPDLKPARSNKKELGLAFDIRNVSVSVTGFYEKLTDGLTFSSTPYFNAFKKFTVDGAGKMPVFDNGAVYYYENGGRVAASYAMDTMIHTYYRPTNNVALTKKGIEYVINIGRINAINTSFVIDGAWLHQESYNTQPTYSRIYSSYLGQAYPYVAVRPAGSKSITQRMNTNIRMITHIPELKLIISLTPQIIWNLRSKIRWDDGDNNSLVYYYGDNGERIYGNAALQDMEAERYVDPIGFVDKTGTFHPWQEAYSTDSKYAAMVSSYSSSYYFVEESLPPAVQFNLRLTKEFSRNLTLSFMANNFLKMNPSQKSNRTSLYVTRNSDFYFGAEINYKF